MIIGQEGPLSPEEIDLLHNNRNSEIVRIFRKQISHFYAQYAGTLIKADTTDDLKVQQGQLRGLSIAWNIPFMMAMVSAENQKNKKTE